jgi:hypothetical protein
MHKLVCRQIPASPPRCCSESGVLRSTEVGHVGAIIGIIFIFMSEFNLQSIFTGQCVLLLYHEDFRTRPSRLLLYSLECSLNCLQLLSKILSYDKFPSPDDEFELGK